MAVRNVTLSIEDGEFLVLLGPSGCGKSTILKLIAGLEELSDGDIFLGDRRITFAPIRSRDVAMVFQNYALYPHMTVRSNISFPLRMSKRPKAEVAQRVQDASRIVRLDELLDRERDVVDRADAAGELLREVLDDDLTHRPCGL